MVDPPCGTLRVLLDASLTVGWFFVEGSLQHQRSIIPGTNYKDALTT